MRGSACIGINGTWAAKLSRVTKSSSGVQSGATNNNKYLNRQLQYVAQQYRGLEPSNVKIWRLFLFD